MSSRIKAIFKFLIDVERHERLKVFLLTLSFFFVIGAYTVARELKDSIFMSVVGREYIPWAKMLALIVLVPGILFYSTLVDSMRRSHLVYFYAVVYGLLGLLFAYFLGHPTIGIPNTEASPSRLFGWFFYFFIEGFSPFVVSVFWAFANSITSPEAAKNNYTIMVSGSKLGGMLSAIAASWLFSLRLPTGTLYFSDTVNHQILLTVSSLSLLIVPIFIYLLVTKVPSKYLHGYEAVYRVEKKRAEEQGGILGAMSGLIMLFRYPYMLGIFGMLFFYEIIYTVFSYQRLVIGQAASTDMSGVTAFLFEQAFWSHGAGLLFTLFGARPLVNWFGEKRSLLLIPLLTGLIVFYFLITPSPSTIIAVFILMRSINYALAQPLREALYIPTVKEMKFKTKSWIDAFGSKIAKASGSTVNVLLSLAGQATVSVVHGIFFSVVVGVWTLVAYLLGRRYEQAVKNNEVIGQERV